MNIFNTSFNYERRLDTVRNLMDERGIDAILVHLWPNQYYLSEAWSDAWRNFRFRARGDEKLRVYNGQGGYAG